MNKSNPIKQDKIILKIKEVFLKNNCKKIILIKLIIFIAIISAILGIVFGLRTRFVDYLGQGIVENTGFININVITNSGIGFGQFSDSTALVYFLQSFILIIFLIIFLFNRKISILIPLAMIISGSFGNIIDRATSIYILGPNFNNVVLDYFQFWFGGAIFNFADSSIVVGFIILFIVNFVLIIKEWYKENNKRKKEIELKKEAVKSKIESDIK